MTTDREDDTPEPTMSPWAEARRHLMTPETIAANERLHAARTSPPDDDAAEALAAQGVHERWWNSPFDQTWTNCIIPDDPTAPPTEGATRDD